MGPKNGNRLGLSLHGFQVWHQLMCMCVCACADQRTTSGLVLRCHTPTFIFSFFKDSLSLAWKPPSSLGWLAFLITWELGLKAHYQACIFSWPTMGSKEPGPLICKACTLPSECFPHPSAGISSGFSLIVPPTAPEAISFSLTTILILKVYLEVFELPFSSVLNLNWYLHPLSFFPFWFLNLKAFLPSTEIKILFLFGFFITYGY